MIKALLIASALVAAWVSGVGVGSNEPRHQNGAAWLLVLAVLCGVAVWSL